MNNDPLAPKLSANMLDNIIAEHRRRQKTNGFTVHKPVPKSEPNRFCKICTKVFHSDAILAGPTMQAGVCPECQQELDKGMIAITCPILGKHCFVYSFTLAGKQQILECSEEVWNRLEEEYKKQKENQ